ncbi:hypothetical protein PGRAN_09466 [Listeria grandensis FSL F6-0971]|uniref:Cyclic nucleotide-binding domain-containing protein n=1 Tax=Listeria grandensis FSL F6-0971 TaxID=1265819 RepID=W7BEA7_9LIST|nr:Crp/Fnr family transcriptional regulator [Listeria grandensis]EUJ23150.1 hypothetical protein PGRAN_09466 [Listeria grandensis FSL F6-0971]
MLSYIELYDKDVIDKTFSSNKLLDLLLDDDIYVIDSKKITLEKGEVIFNENDVHDYIYVIASGICGAWKNGHVTNFYGHQEVIGMDDILSNERSFVTVSALMEVEAWKFSKEQVMAKLMFTQEGVFFLYNNMKVANMDLLHKDAMHLEDTKERLLASLIKLGKRYGEVSSYEIKLPKVFTKKIIANHLNLNPGTMSILCKQLEVDGILEKSLRQILIINRKKGELYR